MDHLRCSAEAGQVGDRGVESLRLRVVQRVLGFVAAREVAHRRTQGHRAVDVRLRHPLGEIRPLVHRNAAAIEAGVHLRGDDRRPAGAVCRRDHRVELGDRRECDVDAVDDRSGEVGSRRVQPRGDRGVDAGGAERGGLGEVRDPEFGGAGREHGAGHRQGAMAVGVGLHDRHHVSARSGAQHADVVGDRAEIHGRGQSRGSHRRPLSQIAGCGSSRLPPA